MKPLLFAPLLLLAVLFTGCGAEHDAVIPKSSFVKREGCMFQIDGKPYYFIGANYWYGAILGSKGQGGDRKRLLAELDFLEGCGVNNLRVLVGADGVDGRPSVVMPALQSSPGVYNDSILDGLDFLLSEMAKRKMYAVLYLCNSWEWSGGFAQYLEWSGNGKMPIPSVDGYQTFANYVKGFASSEKSHALLKDHVAFIINRTNRYSQKRYVDDDTIMAWQIANEPRAFSAANKPAFAAWLGDMAAFIKSLDKNHLVSSGSEGSYGTEEDIGLYEKIHADPNIDYFTIHIWPYNWGWLNPKDVPGSLEKSVANTNNYMQQHIALAQRHNKPIVLEEFGWSRDHQKYTANDPTITRDVYFKNIFDQVLRHAADKSALAGCNFWAWAGSGRPASNHPVWKAGDSYIGDPAQDPQGLNSVYDTDSTISLIKEYNEKLRRHE